MTKTFKAMVLTAGVTASSGLAQPVQAATAVVQLYPVITQLGNAQKSVTEVRWRGRWGHGRYWRHGGWGHRGWGWRQGWGYRPWGWGYRHYGWGYPGYPGYPGYGCGGYGCYYSRPVIFFGTPWDFRF